jgi:DNA-binding NtrC family response regulator
MTSPEKRELRRLGGTKTIPIDVRLISATNRNLRAEVKRQTFREDLYFRVAGARVYVPPVRERMDDLPILIEHFLAASEPARTLRDVPEPLWDAFRSYRWPGNVRELRNAVQRMLITPERVFEPEPSSFAPPPLAETDLPPLRVARREAVDSFELRYLEALLAKAHGNVTRAAAQAQVSRQAIHLLMTKHGL